MTNAAPKFTPLVVRAALASRPTWHVCNATPAPAGVVASLHDEGLFTPHGIYAPKVMHGVTVGFPAAQSYGLDSRTMVCAESPVVAHRVYNNRRDYFVAGTDLLIHDCTGGCFGLFNDRALIRTFYNDLEAFAFAVGLVDDRGQS